MNPTHVVWSAQACPFRRAGVYYGLSEDQSHDVVATLLQPRRGACFAPGQIQIRPGEPAPLRYFAVRDPSAVRIVPIRGGKRSPSEEFAHVRLIFSGGGRGPSPTPSSQSIQDLAPPDQTPAGPLESPPDSAASSHAGFVVTVGLRTDREAEFHERLVLSHPDLTYAALCERIMALREEFSR